MKHSLRSIPAALALLAISLTAWTLGGCSDSSDSSLPFIPRDGKAITGFKIGNEAGVIDEAAQTIRVRVPYNADLTLSYELSPGATLTLKTPDIGSGVSVYTVQAENGDTVDYTVYVTAEGQGGITLAFADEAETAIGGEEKTISKSGTGHDVEFTLTASAGFEGCEWWVDGTSKSESRSITLSAGAYSLGKHHVSVEVWKDGVVYSKETAFTVVD